MSTTTLTLRSPAEGRPTESTAKSAEVTLGPNWGWTSSHVADATVSVKGYLFEDNRTLVGAQAATQLVRLVGGASTDEQLKYALTQLGGHFAFVMQTSERILASVDRIRSSPLVWAQKNGVTYIDDRGRRLRDRLGLTERDIDPDQALACATAGYTIGAATLYRGLHSLRPGEALLIDFRGARVLRWFVYDAWRVEEINQPERRLSELNRFIIERLAFCADGRPICIPLSAGLDSRMLAAGLHAVGYRNVRLFSYGRPGNHEAETARRVAEKLDYPWTFVPFQAFQQRALFSDRYHEEALWRQADSCACVPFEQDWIAIATLRESGWIPSDALIVNGQSGDFITGNHVPDALAGGEVKDGTPRRDQVYASYLAKHHALWRSLSGRSTYERITALLDAEVSAAGGSFERDYALHGIHESLEYQDRQAKYVVSGQRTYEALQCDWRLPLWDDEYVLFWRRAPLALKAGQALYRRVLQSDNWGQVWGDVPLNAKTIQPRWIVPLRFITKVAIAPFGRERWHHVERRVFHWWTDPLRIAGLVSYRRALLDKRGPRNAVAWLVERYLAQHGLAIDHLSSERP